MAKTLGLDIVIGAAIGGAIGGFKSVISESDKLGSAIESLNSKKLTILDEIEKEFKSKLEPIESELNKFYEKQKELKLKIKVKDNELKEFRKKIRDTEKEIKSLKEKRLDLEEKFKNGEISANSFNSKIKRIEENLSKLQKKKLGLKEKIELISKKSTSLNNSLKSVSHTIDNLKDKKLKLTDELEKAKEKAIEANNELKTLGKSIEKLNKLKIKLQAAEVKREEFKSKIFDTIAIGATVSFPVKQAIEFESAMADVVKVANLSESETKKMSLALEKLSTKIPISAEGLAKIAASGASLGIAKNKLIDFTKVVAKMSTAFDMSADEAGDAVAKIMNVYGLNIKEATKLGDVLNYLSDNTAAKARDMINVLSRIGGTAKMFGLSAKEASALADAFLAMGKPPEIAATAINALLTKLNTATKQGKQFQQGLKALGLNAIDIQFAIKKDPQKAIMMVLNRIKKFDKQTQMSILTNMFGAEYSDDIALLVSGLDNYKKALKLANNEQGYHNSMQREFENRSKTTANQLQLLGNSLNRIAIDLGSVVLPVIKDFAKAGSFIADKIATLNSEFPILGKVITYVAVGFGAFVITSAIAGYAFSIVSSAVTKARIALTLLSSMLNLSKIKIIALDKATKIYAFTTSILSKSLGILGGAFRFIGNIIRTNPIGAAITIIALGAYLIYENWDKLKGFFNELWSGIKSVFRSTWDFIKNIISFSPIGIIVNNWSTISNYFSQFWNWLKNKFTIGINFISNIFSHPVQTISSIWSSLANWFNSFWGNLKSGFKSGVSIITNIFLHPINTIQNIWNKLLGWISNKIKWIASIGSKIKNFFGFGGDEEKKLTIKPVVEKVKPIVTASALAATTTTAQPINTLKPVSVQSIQPEKPVSVPINTRVQSVKKASSGPDTIVYNFNFGDLKLDIKDGKIINPDEFKAQIEKIIEDMNFEHKQRSLNDVV